VLMDDGVVCACISPEKGKNTAEAKTIPADNFTDLKFMQRILVNKNKNLCFGFVF
jgi:hypothetical protein